MDTNRRRICFAAVVMLMPTIFAEQPVQGDEALQQRLLTEGPRGWNAWRDRSRRLEGWGMGVYTGLSPVGTLP